jgi:predicted ArsR family transcriptional regulator
VEVSMTVTGRPGGNGIGGRAGPSAAPGPPGAGDALDPARRRVAGIIARPPAQRLVDALQAAGRGLTARELADILDRHHSRVRPLLAELEAAGAVEAQVDPPGSRGRPARRYVLVRDPAEREAAGHQELVRLIMLLVRTAGFGAAEVERFGELHGAGIVEPGGGVGQVREVLARLGFAPRETHGDAEIELVLRRCPVADRVREPGGRLICLLHRGLARGAAMRAAPEVAQVALEARPGRRGGCRLRILRASGRRTA